MSTPHPYAPETNVDSTAAQTRHKLLQTLAERLDSGRYDAALAVAPDTSAIDDLADRILAGLPTTHPLDGIVGPFYDTAGLTTWLDVSRQAIHKQVIRRRILGLKTADDVMLYPAFQFDVFGAPLPSLRDVLDLLDPQDADPWGSAVWLATPATELHGTTPAQCLRAGQLDAVLAVASRINQAEQAW